MSSIPISKEGFQALEQELDRLKKEFGDEYVIVLRTHYYVRKRRLRRSPRTPGDA